MGSPTALEQMCERGSLPGYEVDVIGSRAPIGAYHLLHLCNVGPATLDALLIARAVRLPVLASFHAALTTPGVLHDSYGDCDVVLSPSTDADEVLRDVGVADGALARWHGGVDPHRFHPARYCPDALPALARARLNVLHVGRLEHGLGLDLLAEAFLIAHDHDPRLHLLLAGRGPAEAALRERLGPTVSIASGLDREAQAEALRQLRPVRVHRSPAIPSAPASSRRRPADSPVLALDTGAGHEAHRHGSQRLSGPRGCLRARRRDPRPGPPCHPPRAPH